MSQVLSTALAANMIILGQIYTNVPKAFIVV